MADLQAKMDKLRILVIDLDGTQVIDLMELALAGREISGKTVELRSYTGADAAVAALDNARFDIIVTDIDFREGLGGEGPDFRRYLEKLSLSGLPMIAISGSYSAERAVEAMKAGAGDFILKDSGDLSALKASLEHTIQMYEMRRKVERERWKSYNIFRQAVDSTSDCIMIADTDLRVSFANQAALKLFEITGKPGVYTVPELFSEKSSKKISDSLKSVLEESRDLLIQVEHEKAGPLALSIHSCGEEGTQAALVMVHQAGESPADGSVDEHNMEAIARVLTSLAQRLNNLMTPLASSLGLLAMDEEDEEKKGFLRDADRSARVITEITRQLLGLGKLSARQMERMDLNGSVTKAVVNYRGENPENIEVIEEYADSLSPVKGSATQLQEMVLQLLRNAGAAMPDGGKLTVKTYRFVVKGDGSTEIPGLSAGEYALLEIEDFGMGIGSNAMKKVFEPFYTSGTGQGLGLPIAYSTVKSHGGTFHMQSELGKGTRVSVALPVMSSEELDPYTGKSYTVLVIDDEDQVRYMTKKVLERKKCKVLEAGDGIEGEEIFSQNEDKIDLVVLDAMMPRRSGRETLEVLLKLKPDLKVLVFSGCDTDGAVREMMESGASDFVLKPYNVNDFLEKVINIIEEG